MPVMFEQLLSDDLPEDVQAELGAVLACRAYQQQTQETPKAWVMGICVRHQTQVYNIGVDLHPSFIINLKFRL
jgi:hypothetical protein